MRKILVLVLVALLVTLPSCRLSSDITKVINEDTSDSRENMTPAQNTVTIDNTVYRDGFYGTLYTHTIPRTGVTYQVDGRDFYGVDCEQFDLMYSFIEGTDLGVLFCAESQWEQASAYYSDANNMEYICMIDKYSDDPLTITIPDMDTAKFDALMVFADENGYDPFDSKQEVDTCIFPLPDRDESHELTFYKISKDGFFNSFRGDSFYVIDGKLVLLFYYDYGNEDDKKMLAVEVPDEVGLYFIDLMMDYDY